jgi:hypothetical protein
LAYQDHNLEFCSIYDLNNISHDKIIVSSMIKRSASLRVGNEIIGSSLSRTDLGAYIIARFINNNQLEFYPGIVRFFFQHNININGRFIEHSFAFVDWFKPSLNRYLLKTNQQLHNNKKELFFVELFEPEFYSHSRDNILPVQRIYCRFVRGKFQVRSKEL